ncbi:hypothetical protein [Streptomyces virginiae]|uniref:hypothetical protein n=1 Tax=Streptomyces virginiae TaxID=1961 RepID=UPI002F9078C0
MAIVAGTAASVWTVEASVRDAVGRSRVEAGGVVEGVSPWGETLPPSAVVEEVGQQRVEVRVSLFVQPEELVAALLDSEGAWSTPGVLESDEMARYYTVTHMMVYDGPGSPRMAELVAEVYGSETETEEFERAREVVSRVFGVMAPAALTVV